MLDAPTITLYPKLCRYNASNLSFKTWLVWFSSQLSSPRRVMVTFPVILVDFISMRWVFPTMIVTVEVWAMTGQVSQGSFKFLSTVTVIAVIVLILGCEGIATVLSKWVTAAPVRGYILSSPSQSSPSRLPKPFFWSDQLRWKSTVPFSSF